MTDAVAYLLWALALNGTANTAKVANRAYLTPFLSLIVSAIFLKEQLQIQALVALIFIIGGIMKGEMNYENTFVGRFHRSKRSGK